MDLIYTNASREDIGVLLNYDLDLAFGADENSFECVVQAASHCCEAGSLLYMEGTEYGGMVDSIESNTESKEVKYKGRTWHGILNSKVLEPDSGEAYLTLSGEANTVIASLLVRIGLVDLFEASSAASGLEISSYKMNRYITAYDGIVKMLDSVGGKLKMAFVAGKVVLSAEARYDYTQDEEFDADQVSFQANKNYKTVNHLICLGSGELAERLVVHLYADVDGNISQEQTQMGLDEVTSIYEYSSVSTEEELISEGRAKFKEMLSTDEISIDFDMDSDTYDVGDLVGAYDNITGLYATAKIAKKIVTIKNGQITISLSPDTAKMGSSMEVGGGGGSSGGAGVSTFNGRSGEVVPESGDYTAGMVGAYTKEETDQKFDAFPLPVQIITVWTNPAFWNEFAAQTLTIPAIIGADAVIVQGIDGYHSFDGLYSFGVYGLVTPLLTVGHLKCTSGSGTSSHYTERRMFAVNFTAGTIKFGDASRNGTKCNNQVIPEKIYIVKGVQ